MQPGLHGTSSPPPSHPPPFSPLPPATVYTEVIPTYFRIPISRFSPPSQFSMDLATKFLEDREYVRGFLRKSHDALLQSRLQAESFLDQLGIEYHQKGSVSPPQASPNCCYIFVCFRPRDWPKAPFPPRSFSFRRCYKNLESRKKRVRNLMEADN